MTALRPTVRRIAVGVDGSDASARALEWAVRQADLTGASVEVVTAWEWPPRLGRGMPLSFDYDPAKDAVATANRVVDDVRHTHPDLRIESKVVQGRPAPVLIEASQGAEILVVGNRGRRELIGMALGSVSEHCVASADSPVVVVREST